VGESEAAVAPASADSAGPPGKGERHDLGDGVAELEELTPYQGEGNNLKQDRHRVPTVRSQPRPRIPQKG
jgi:hypothetical protein